MACLSTVALLSACGGGGGGGSGASQSASPAAAPMQPSVVDSSVSASSSVTPASPSTSGTGAVVASNTASGPSTTSVTSSADPVQTPQTLAQTPTTTSGTDGPFGQDASTYTLAFSDEFNTDSLNANVWNDHIWYESANGTKNYTVENGSLKIWPQRDSTGNFFNRTIDTDGHYYQTYGYFEIEAKLPVGMGTWPAFWLFNHIGARRPEIDIMEAYAGGAAPWGVTGSDGVKHPTMYAATIWKDATVQAGMQKVATPDLSSAFHKYALKWEANKQTYYFDGKEVFTINVAMTDPMYLMLDLWFGSASGTPDTTTPQGKANSYEVNYVRAWKFK